MSRNIVFALYCFIFPLTIGMILVAIPALVPLGGNTDFAVLGIGTWITITLTWAYVRIGFALHSDLESPIPPLIPYAPHPPRRIFPFYYFFDTLVISFFTSLILYWAIGLASISLVPKISVAAANFMILAVPLCSLYRKTLQKAYNND